MSIALRVIVPFLLMAGLAASSMADGDGYGAAEEKKARAERDAAANPYALTIADAGPHMSDEERAAMEAWVKSEAIRLTQQELLQKMAGNWKTLTKWWTSPDAPPESSEGTATFTPILGDRFMRQDFKNKAMGMDFEGVGHLGYDISGKFVATWIDNSSTQIVSSTCEMKADVLHCQDEALDPGTGKPATHRSTYTGIGTDKIHFEMYGKDDGVESKTLDIVYTR